MVFHLQRQNFQVVQKQSLPIQASDNILICLIGFFLLLDILKHLHQKISLLIKEQENVFLLDMNLSISRTFSTAGQLLNMSTSMIFHWPDEKYSEAKLQSCPEANFSFPSFLLLSFIERNLLLDNLKHLHQPHQNHKEERVLPLKLNLSISITFSSVGQV